MIAHIEAGVKTVARVGEEYQALKGQYTRFYLISMLASLSAGFALCLLVFWPNWPGYLRPLCLIALVPWAALIPQHLIMQWRLAEKDRDLRSLCRAMAFVSTVRFNGLCHSYDFWGRGLNSQNIHLGLSWSLKPDEVQLFVNLLRHFGHPIRSY